MNIKNIVKTHFLISDFLLCCLLLCILFICNKKLNWNIFSFLLKGNRLKEAYASLFSASVSVFVFLITSISILFAFLENKSLEILKNTQQPKTIFQAVVYSIACSGVLSLLLLATFFLYDEEILFWIIITVLFVMIASIFSVI